MTDPDTTKSYRRSPGQSRLIWGKNAQVSFSEWIQDRVRAAHSSGGSADRHLTRDARSGGDGRDVSGAGPTVNTLFLPGGMVHSARNGGQGADQVDVFWPVRPDYVERAQKQRALDETSRRAGHDGSEAGRRLHLHRRPDVAQGAALFLRHVLPESGSGRLDGKPGEKPADCHGARRQMARALARDAVERHDCRQERQSPRVRHVRSPRGGGRSGKRQGGARRARQGGRQAD